MSRETLVAHLERKREWAEAYLDEFRAIEEQIRDEESSYFGYVTLRWGLAQRRSLDRLGRRDPARAGGAAMRVALAILAVALVAVPAADGYRNPTAGKALVLQLPGMHRAKVKREHRLPAVSPAADGRLPAAERAGSLACRPPRRASGLRPDERPEGRLGATDRRVRAERGCVRHPLRRRAPVAAQPGRGCPGRDRVRPLALEAPRVDPNRLCTLGFSAPWHLWATMRDPRSWLRCNVVYYEPLDLQSRELGDEFSALAYLRRSPASIPPMLVVKAGRDANAGTNESIDRFQAAATELHADVRVVTDPGAAHGFDVGPRTARARAIVKQTLRFLKARLAPPLPVTESCATKAEKASALRFFGADDTTLLGVVVGSGPRGVVLRTARTRASASGCPTRASSRPAAIACSPTTRGPGTGSTSTSRPRSRRSGEPGRRT